jgi:hypothetical protein
MLEHRDMSRQLLLVGLVALMLAVPLSCLVTMAVLRGAELLRRRCPVGVEPLCSNRPRRSVAAVSQIAPAFVGGLVAPNVRT